jgi:hypothetical protein
MVLPQNVEMFFKYGFELQCYKFWTSSLYVVLNKQQKLTLYLKFSGCIGIVIRK